MCRHMHSQPLTENCTQFALGPVRPTYIPAVRASQGGAQRVGAQGTSLGSEQATAEKKGIGTNVLFVFMYVPAVHPIRSTSVS